MPIPDRIRCSTAIVATVLTSAFCLPAATALAQAPTGGLEGTVVDTQGRAVSTATVDFTDEATGLNRGVLTDENGTFRLRQVPPGHYTLTVAAPGFRRTSIATVRIAVGTTTPCDVTLGIGNLAETADIKAGEATVSREDHEVSGTVSAIQINSLPLNGRNFLDLAALQPGTETIDGYASDPTKLNSVGVSIAGGTGLTTQILVDGGSVVDNADGTTAQNFSEEAIAEFQVGMVNQDISSGATGSGTINVVTKSGSNGLHGNGYLFYRDDQFAAFPGLQRSADTDLSDAYVPVAASRLQFDREQFGGTLDGPLVKDTAFFFLNVEYNNQNSVSIFNTQSPFIHGFSGFGTQPYDGLLVTGKLDWKLNTSNSVFIRYSHDGNSELSPYPPGTGIVPRESRSGIFSSNSVVDANRSDGIVAGVTSVWSASLVNDLRYNVNSYANTLDPDPTTVSGSPHISVAGTYWRSGTNFLTPQATRQLRNQVRDDVSLTAGSHSVRFGVDWEQTRISGRLAWSNPAFISIWGPDITNKVLENEADFLNSPVRYVYMGVGDSRIPFGNSAGSDVNSRIQAYASDTWKLGTRLTLNLGLAYSYETAPWNTKLSRPNVIAPVFEDGTAPPRSDTNNWGPRAGFAWDICGDARTVIRGGFGWYYDTTLQTNRLFEPADLSPPGSELLLSPEDIRSALLPAGTGRSVGDGVFGAAPGSSDGYITLRRLLAILPQLRRELEARLAGSTAPTSIEAVGAVSGPLYATRFQLPYSLDYSIGVQHEFGWNIVLQADLVYRRGLHEPLVYDANMYGAVDRHGNAISYLPVERWNNSVLYADSGGVSAYRALLVRVDKRMSRNLMFTASYALSRAESIVDQTNLFDLRASYGPAGLDRTHRVVVSGIFDLPRYTGDMRWMKRGLDGWSLSWISTAFSGTPYSVFLPDGIDLSGTNTGTSYLPGTGAGAVGRAIQSVEQLNRLIRAYNANLTRIAARLKRNGNPIDPQGTVLRRLAELPADTPIGGDSLLSTDVRLTKAFDLSDGRIRLDLFAEVFNAFNVSNLRDVADTSLAAQKDVDNWLDNIGGFNPGHLPYPFTTFAPTSRQTSVFGSGGPRAFQFGVKFTF